MEEMEHGDAEKAEVPSSCGSSAPESTTSTILQGNEGEKIYAPQNILGYVSGISNETKQRDGGTLGVLADLPSVDFGDNYPRLNGGGRRRDGSCPCSSTISRHLGKAAVATDLRGDRSSGVVLHRRGLGFVAVGAAMLPLIADHPSTEEGESIASKRPTLIAIRLTRGDAAASVR